MLIHNSFCQYCKSKIDKGICCQGCKTFHLSIKYQEIDAEIESIDREGQAIKFYFIHHSIVQTPHFRTIINKYMLNYLYGRTAVGVRAEGVGQTLFGMRAEADGQTIELETIVRSWSHLYIKTSISTTELLNNIVKEAKDKSISSGKLGNVLPSYRFGNTCVVGYSQPPYYIEPKKEAKKLTKKQERRKLLDFQEKIRKKK